VLALPLHPPAIVVPKFIVDEYVVSIKNISE
jgi:hypothetical protein